MLWGLGDLVMFGRAVRETFNGLIALRILSREIPASGINIFRSLISARLRYNWPIKTLIAQSHDWW